MKSTRPVRALIGLLLAAGLAACGSSGEVTGIASTSGAGGGGAFIGVSMPTVTSERWVNDGQSLKSKLENLGYRVDLQYAQNDVPAQASQIQNQIMQGAQLLIIAAIDGTAIGQQLQEAADKKIPVISYDRLIRNSPNVSYYTSFDNYKVGVAQATSLLTGLGILKPDGTGGDAHGPFNIEIFAGSPDDSNATFFYNGAMDTLKSYIDKGTLVVKSGQKDFKSIATLRWDPAAAQKRMEGLLAKSYNGRTTVHGVLSPYDGISIAILSALKHSGYGTADRPYPVVTGQDAEYGSVKSIIAGEQYSTIFKDTRELAKVTVKMADDILEGNAPETNNTKDYDNGKKVVPAYLLQPVIVTKSNYKKALFETGYYSQTEFR